MDRGEASERCFSLLCKNGCKEERDRSRSSSLLCSATAARLPPPHGRGRLDIRYRERCVGKLDAGKCGTKLLSCLLEPTLPYVRNQLSFTTNDGDDANDNNDASNQLPTSEAANERRRFPVATEDGTHAAATAGRERIQEGVALAEYSPSPSLGRWGGGDAGKNTCPTSKEQGTLEEFTSSFASYGATNQIEKSSSLGSPDSNPYLPSAFVANPSYRI